jgi:RIO-like serine/threonine protein kinase
MSEAAGRPAPGVLKSDLFGTLSLTPAGIIVRDTRAARWWTAPLARHLARRERRALQVLLGMGCVPQLLAFDGRVLQRSFIAGRPMQQSRPTDPAYFRAAHRLVRRLHQHNVVHNDLAKEPNWLVTEAGEPALVDFQLAWVTKRRGRLFRSLAHDDIRHLLKHKRTYLPQLLTQRERRILAKRSLVSRIWMATGKRVYWFVTRKIFGWADREGAGDRRL